MKISLSGNYLLFFNSHRHYFMNHNPISFNQNLIFLISQHTSLITLLTIKNLNCFFSETLVRTINEILRALALCCLTGSMLAHANSGIIKFEMERSEEAAKRCTETHTSRVQHMWMYTSREQHSESGEDATRFHICSHGYNTNTSASLSSHV